MRRTGGGSGERCLLSELDKRLVAVMGGTSFASGDSELAVNPFLQTVQQIIQFNYVYLLYFIMVLYKLFFVLQSSAVEPTQPTPATSQNVVEIEEIPFEDIMSPPPPPTAGTSREEAAADTAPPQAS